MGINYFIFFNVVIILLTTIVIKILIPIIHNDHSKYRSESIPFKVLIAYGLLQLIFLLFAMALVYGVNINYNTCTVVKNMSGGNNE